MASAVKGTVMRVLPLPAELLYLNEPNFGKVPLKTRSSRRGNKDSSARLIIHAGCLSK